MSPQKFIRCVEEVLEKNKKKVNAYAVCRVATGFFGSTHEKKKR